MAESPFKPMKDDEMRNLAKQNKSLIVKDLTHIRDLLLKLRDTDMLESGSMGRIIEDLEEGYGSEKDDPQMKPHWEGISQTLTRLDTFHRDLLHKYADLVAELNKGGTMDRLIEDLDSRLNELVQ